MARNWQSLRYCGIGILIAACLTAPLSAQPRGKSRNSQQSVAAARLQEERRAKLREVLARFHAQSRFPGIIAGAYFADGASVVVAVGEADRERHTPMTDRALLHAGSVGKTLFAALALQLAGEGRLGLDDKMSQYLGAEPWYAQIPNGATITIRMLLNHTSGIPEYGESFMRALIADPGRRRTPLDAVRSVLDAKPLFPAGTAFAYTDVNYQLLQLVTERITGKSAYSEIEARFLRPMRLSGLVPADRRDVPGLVPGYAGKDSFLGFDAVMKDGGLIMDPSFEGGGGGFITNPGDLARWIALFCEAKVFPRALLAEAEKGVPAGQLDLGSNAQSGLGIEIFETPLGIAYGHGGFFPGYISGVLWYRERGIAIAIQVNSSAPNALARPLREVFHEAARALTEQEKIR